MAGANGASRFLVPLISGAIALVAIGMASPRVVAYAFVAPWSSVVAPAFATGRQIEAGPLAEAVHAYSSATTWLSSDGFLQQDRGRLLMRQAQNEEAAAAMRASLAAAPNRALAWSLLAYLDNKMGASAEALTPLLRLSYATGPREASSMLLRPAVPLDHWADMPDDIKDAVRAELRRLYETPWMRRRFFRLYIAQGFAGRIVIRNAVISTSTGAEKFNREVCAAAGLTPAAP
jgi:tetratricopeptide (TPR) repeat protein